MYIKIHHKDFQNHQGFKLPTSDTWRATIGSSKEADYRVNKRVLRPVHAVLSGRAGKVFVESGSAEADIQIDGRSISFPTRLRIHQSFTMGGIEFSIRDPLLDTQPARIPIHTDHVEDESGRTLIRGANRRLKEPTASASATLKIVLNGDQVIIGRTIQGPGRIDDPQVSREHAVIRKQGTRWTIRDSGSTNGTFINGESASRWRELNIDDVVAFGSLLFSFDGTCLKRADSQDGVRVDVLELTKTVRHRDTGKALNLIDDMSMSVLPGEFVVMLGSSGCGKSTFMDAINGRRRSTSGRVLFNGRDLYDEFPSLKRAIGYVPQEVIYHKALSVEDILLHAAHLRLPTDTTPSEVEDRIQAVLDRVGLSERRKTPAMMLSGGQQKRVSIAIELLSQPKVLFLDEVTSGLDMKTEREMMTLFRQLADDGITIFCITHHLESLDTCHHIAYFFKGKLAFFGSEDQFKAHFEIDHACKVYDCEEGADPIEWEDRYVKSDVGTKLLTERLKMVKVQGGGEHSARTVAAEHSALSAERTGVQTATLTRRYIKLLLADRATLGVTLALAPIIGGVMAFASVSWPETMGFQALNVSTMAIVIVFFFGLFTSSREIVRDLTVYLHERMVGLEIIPYLVSRIVPLAIIGLFQVLVFVGILRMFTDFEHVGSWLTVVPVLYATTFSGSMFGLFISALVDKVDTAVSLMIFAVVPQLLFAGNLGELEHPQKAVASTFVSSYWAYDAAEAMLEMPRFESDTNIDDLAIGIEPAASTPVQPQGSGDGSWWLQVVIILSQAFVFLAGTFLLVLRRDGSGAIKRFFAGAGRVVQTRNKDDLLVVTDWVVGASKGLRKS